MLINTFLDTEDFVHLYYPEDEPAAQGCGAGARMASKYPARPPSPEYKQVASSSAGEMSERERYRAPPQPEPPPHRVRAADLYPRVKTHYDEPGLDAGFTPICGEFVKWVGRTADGGTIAMSTYRLHLQPRRRESAGASVPLRLIDALEICDLLCLLILCKHGRQLKCTFSTREQCLEWWRRLTTALAPLTSLKDTFAAAYAAWAKEQPPSSVHRALLRASHSPQRHWFGPEVERLGFTTKGAWRVSAANAEFKLCPSYPPLLIVPASIGDEVLDSVASFRAMRRIPAVVWRHRGNGAVIARSSQPEVGWLGWRSPEDERLLAAFVAACNADRGTLPPTTNKQLKMLIVDARSYASAVTNRARGGGCESEHYYLAADIQFMSLPNIHHVRRSFQQLRALIAEPEDQANWHSSLERSLWLQYVSGVLRAAGVVALAVQAGRPVLVHCSDGWDRTPQIVAAAQLALDPHYRTVEGFRVLIEREWLDFGHKFAERCGHHFGREDPNERSPIFLQWLDVVHQMMLQYPCSFEFNEAYLVKLATHVHSCMFGTFLCNSARERGEVRAESAAHVWQLLRAPAYRNHLYSPHQHQVLWAECSVRAMQPWWGLLCGERERHRHAHSDAPPAPAPAPPAHNGLMTKTRSCDNLLSDGEKRTTQRRCSDPSIASDVMKLSSLVAREGRGALTDSCVDELAPPAGPAVLAAQVEGLHPEHFSKPAVGSASSSLERELGSAVDCADGTDAADGTDGTDCTDSSPRDQRPPYAMQNGEASDISTSLPRIETTPEGETPEEPPVFVCEPYTDVITVPEAPKEIGRTRNISITWRSISESSNQSSTGFDISGTPPAMRAVDRPVDQQIEGSVEREIVTIDNHNCTEGDIVNHNVDSDVTSRNDSVLSNGTVNGLNDITAKFLQAELNGGASSSGASSESEGEGSGSARGAASQLTLRPASPRRARCTRCACARDHGSDGSETCWCGGGAGEADGALLRVRCVCGAGARPHHDSPDGLPPAADPLQDRLHQIILYHKKVVEELSGQLREAREALRRASSPLNAQPPARASPSAPSPTQMAQSVVVGVSAGVSGCSGGSAGSGGSSSSGSASEVEVGEEVRAAWLPDSAAPRCQHCRNHFWLARRRHHCRRCGGIFCGSCSEMSPWGECGAVRVCRRCRELR